MTALYESVFLSVTDWVIGIEAGWYGVGGMEIVRRPDNWHSATDIQNVWAAGL